MGRKKIDLFEACCDIWFSTRAPFPGTPGSDKTDRETPSDSVNTLLSDWMTSLGCVGRKSRDMNIVMGGSNYSALAPPGSFIDTSYYLSPKDLTSSKDFPDGFSQIGCNLCKALHELHDSIHSCVSVQVFHMHCRLLCNHRLPRSGQA